MSSGAGLRVLDEDVEVAVLVEDAGVEQLELGRARRRARGSPRSAGVRVLGLRVLVEELHVGVRRRRVEVEVVLLHVLAVVRLRPARRPNRRSFRIGSRPFQSASAKHEHLIAVADAGDAVLAPAVRLASARGRAGSSPRRRRPRCSPRAPCPTRARDSTAPTSARAARASRASRPVFPSQCSASSESTNQRGETGQNHPR